MAPILHLSLPVRDLGEARAFYVDVLGCTVTLDREELDALVARLDGAGARWLCPLGTDDPGTPLEQTKAKVLDPSGNAIELKSYADPSAALSP